MSIAEKLMDFSDIITSVNMEKIENHGQYPQETRRLKLADFVTDENLEHAYSVARAAIPRIRNTSLDREELESEAALSLTNAAAAWLDPENGHDVSDLEAFRKYFSRAVKRDVSSFITRNKNQVSMGGHDLRYKKPLFDFAETRGVPVSELTDVQLGEFRDEQDVSISDDRLASIRDSFSQGEESLDAPVFEDDSSGHEYQSLASDGVDVEELDDSASYHLNPESILLIKERIGETKGEASVVNDEISGDTFRQWISLLPKKMRQVLNHKHIYSWNRNQSGADSKTISNKKFGGTAHSGLSMSPTEIDAHELQAFEVLRAFSNGDFSQAEFDLAARELPKDKVVAFMDSLEDEFEKALLDYGLLKEYTQTRIRDGKEVTSVIRRNYKHVAKKWLKRLQVREGIETLQEAEHLAKETQNRLYRELLEEEGMLKY